MEFKKITNSSFTESLKYWAVVFAIMWLIKNLPDLIRSILNI